jgi:hypothetical protein
MNRKPLTKRKKPTRIKTKPLDPQKEAAVVPTKSFHETFPLTLEFKEGKDKKLCMFQCQEHLDSYLKRYKLKKNQYKVYPTKPKENNEEKE